MIRPFILPAHNGLAASSSPSEPVSRRYRDGRLGSIGGGADEVMLGIIAKQRGLLPEKSQ
jgi:alkylation response protein AidB-like acyl-CoA dehydrogenase